MSGQFSSARLPGLSCRPCCCIPTGSDCILQAIYRGRSRANTVVLAVARHTARAVFTSHTSLVLNARRAGTVCMRVGRFTSSAGIVARALPRQQCYRIESNNVWGSRVPARSVRLLRQLRRLCHNLLRSVLHAWTYRWEGRRELPPLWPASNGAGRQLDHRYYYSWRGETAWKPRSLLFFVYSAPAPFLWQCHFNLRPQKLSVEGARRDGDCGGGIRQRIFGIFEANRALLADRTVLLY